MVKQRPLCLVVLIIVLVFAAAALAEEAGSIRGTVSDKEYDAPLGVAEVLIAETGEKVTSTEEGTYVFGQVKPGTYTLVFSKDGYARQVKADVVVTEGKMTEIEVSLAGEFTEMEEFVVQDMQMEPGTESALLELRMETPALMDSISSELMSRAGASDAASALTLVSGATIQEGKFAVVRGLPDRYVNSQMNGVRLPTADADKRAVQLDQFPAPLIESIQVSKTFTPDQQGDASGGAVNIITKSIPNENVLQFSGELSWNTEAAGRDDFLTYKGGGVNFWGKDDGSRDIQSKPVGFPWDGAVGVSRGDSPQDYKWSIAAGGKHQVDEDVKIGGFGTFFYERDSSFYDNSIDDLYQSQKTQVAIPDPTVPGAFTSADKDKTGLLELAGAGSIFLDEITEIPLELQAKLLRVLQEKTFRKVGGVSDIGFSATIIASSNRDLRREVRENRFRQDLYYRLNICPINIAPLREQHRKQDIRLLANYFLKTSTVSPAKIGKITAFTELAMQKIEQYCWPGNVRELRNVIERAILLETTDKIGLSSIHIDPIESDYIADGDFTAEHAETAEGNLIKKISANSAVSAVSDFSLEKAERELIARALQESGWQKTKAAELLGITRATLYAKVKQHNIQKGVYIPRTVVVS